MTSGSKSKAQRRAESQRRAAEKRAAERRQKQMRIGVRVGGVLVLVALVVIVITQVTGGGGSGKAPAQFTNPHVPLQPIPASMSSTWIQPPATYARARDHRRPLGAEAGHAGERGHGADG